MRRRALLRIAAAAVAGVAIVLLILLAATARKYSFGYAHVYSNPRSLERERPTYYYIYGDDDRPDLATIRARLDPDGVYTSPRDTQWTDPRLRHKVVVVAQIALDMHDQLLDHPSPELEAIFRRQLEWLMHDAIYVLPDSTPVWPEYFPSPRAGLHTRWIGALTHGQAISLLVRAAEYTGDSTYAVWARRAVRAFTGGNLPIVWHGPAGEIFLEEYPCDPPSHVLNGCLLAWLGLWDYARYSGDPAVRDFALRALASIEATLPRYAVPGGSLRGWTRYDAHQRRPTSPGYQEVHAAVAETLHRMFPDDPTWGEYARIWREAANRPWLRTEVFLHVLWDRIRVRLTGPDPVPKGILFPAAEGSR
jgi:hypothetical protein